MICSAVKLISFQLGTCDRLLDLTQLLYPCPCVCVCLCVCTCAHKCLLEEICSLTPPSPLIFFLLLLSSPRDLSGPLSLSLLDIITAVPRIPSSKSSAQSFPFPLLSLRLFVLLSTPVLTALAGGSKGCSVSFTMETQSESRGEELKATGHTRAADAKEDLQESRRIERFDIPLTNLKSMFEKPTTQDTVSERV